MLGRVGKVGRLGSIGGLEGIPAPDLQLNFDQASIGANAAPDDAIDFSRASQATFTDSDGLVKYAPHNLVLQSEDFSTTWTATNATVTTNNTTAPDGTTTADKFSYKVAVEDDEKDSARQLNVRTKKWKAIPIKGTKYVRKDKTMEVYDGESVRLNKPVRVGKLVKFKDKKTGKTKIKISFD